MSWRIVSIAERSHISVQRAQLVIKQSAEEYHVPLEDIGVLLLENHATTLSTALMAACVEHKVALYVCDERHLPCGVLLSYQQHSRQSKVIGEQLNWGESFKKRLWQKIVQQKINNQRLVLEAYTGYPQPELERHCAEVRSGDTLGREATAARHYFSKLLPPGVTRGSDHVMNHALNYGYAIVRGVVARSLAAYGFVNSIGIQHRSELDNHALADDLIEPYRPFVDKLVLQHITPGVEEFDRTKRIEILKVLTATTLVEGKEQTLQRAVELTAQSLVTATTEKDSERLLLPVIAYD